MSSKGVILRKLHNNKEVLIFKNIDHISAFAIEKWKEVSEKAIRDKGYYTVALSGGKTPINLYKKLAEQGDILPWDKTNIFLVDERFVSYEDTENNYRMINTTLLCRINIPAKNIHPISTDEESPQASATKYEEDLLSYFKLSQDKLPIFDLIFLGMGEDGHTASLFPGSSVLTETGRLAIAVSLPDIHKSKRITLTLSVINNADNIIFLVTGSNKAEALREILVKENPLLPAAMVKPRKGRLFFLIDESAAKRISPREIA